MLRTLFYSIINVLIPPRAEESLVNALTIDGLYTLAGQNGLSYHDPRITALVWELKYNANKRALALAGEYLSEELLSVAEEELGALLLVPVPSHTKRRRERGHNQAELLCQAALQHLADMYEYAPHILVRTRNTPPQQTLARQMRLTNVKNSMEASEKVRGRVCVVVDDVSTTGATLAEATRALKSAGARRVHTVALARS